MFDGLGSTRQLLDGAQAVTDSYTYEAFGNSMGSTGSTPNPYKYVGSLGYYACGDGHLLHLGARYYMPEVGRFMQRDPAWAASSMPSVAAYQRSGDLVGDAYTYGRGNPVNLVDPTGLKECKKDTEVTNDKCRKACLEYLDPGGKHPGKYDGYCQKFCSKFIGNSCNQLERWCEHLEQPAGSRKAAQVCWGVYDSLCGN